MRDSNPPPLIHSQPSSPTSNVTTVDLFSKKGGLSWARTTFFCSSDRRYPSSSSQPMTRLLCSQWI